MQPHQPLLDAWTSSSTANPLIVSRLSQEPQIDLRTLRSGPQQPLIGQSNLPGPHLLVSSEPWWRPGNVGQEVFDPANTAFAESQRS